VIIDAAPGSELGLEVSQPAKPCLNSLQDLIALSSAQSWRLTYNEPSSSRPPGAGDDVLTYNEVRGGVC
jgi:hypothetical protein